MNAEQQLDSFSAHTYYSIRLWSCLGHCSKKEVTTYLRTLSFLHQTVDKQLVAR